MFSTYIYRAWWLLWELIQEFCGTIARRTFKAWSMWQHHIPQKHLSIHQFIIELYVLQRSFVRGSNKKQRRGTIISNFIPYSYQPSDNIVTSSPFFHLSKKGFSFPFSLGKRRIYLETQLKGEFTDLFWKLTGCSLFPQAE